MCELDGVIVSRACVRAAVHGCARGRVAAGAGAGARDLIAAATVPYMYYMCWSQNRGPGKIAVRRDSFVLILTCRRNPADSKEKTVAEVCRPVPRSKELAALSRTVCDSIYRKFICSFNFAENLRSEKIILILTCE